jgi:hypothetical protein
MLISTSKNALSFLLLQKLEKRAEQVLPGSKGVTGRGRGGGAEGRNGKNNVCTYE